MMPHGLRHIMTLLMSNDDSWLTSHDDPTYVYVESSTSKFSKCRSTLQPKYRSTCGQETSTQENIRLIEFDINSLIFVYLSLCQQQVSGCTPDYKCHYVKHHVTPGFSFILSRMCSKSNRVLSHGTIATLPRGIRHHVTGTRITRPEVKSRDLKRWIWRELGRDDNLYHVTHHVLARGSTNETPDRCFLQWRH